MQAFLSYYFSLERVTMAEDKRDYTDLLQAFKGQGHFSYQQRVADNYAEFLPQFKKPIKVVRNKN